MEMTLPTIRNQENRSLISHLQHTEGKEGHKARKEGRKEGR